MALLSRPPPELIARVIDATIKPEIPSTDGYVDYFPEEIAAIERFLNHELGGEAAAQELLTLTTEQEEAEAEDRTDTKARRIATTLYSIVMESTELHEHVFELRNAIIAYEKIVYIQKGETLPRVLETGEDWGVGDFFEEMVSEGWTNALRTAYQSIPSDDYSEEWVQLGAWHALLTSHAKNPKLLDHFAPIQDGLERELHYTAENGATRTRGYSRNTQAAAHWLIRCGRLIHHNIGNEKCKEIFVGLAPTQLWPEEKGREVTIERWGFWKERLRWVAATQDVEGLDEDTREIARRAVEEMEVVEKEPRKDEWIVESIPA